MPQIDRENALLCYLVAQQLVSAHTVHFAILLVGMLKKHASGNMMQAYASREQQQNLVVPV